MAIRSRTNRFAHVVERIGLATAGASCGLFVAAHLARVGVPELASIGFVFAMMVAGAIGFYLGIDLPPRPEHVSVDGSVAEPDRVEMLSAIGTFLGPVAALISVGSIVLDLDPPLSWAVLIGACWLIGVLMQIVAGTIARLGR